jgi:hypothetical protein
MRFQVRDVTETRETEKGESHKILTEREKAAARIDDARDIGMVWMPKEGGSRAF